MNTHFTPPQDELERDMEATRRELERTLSALEAKLSVRRKVDDMMSSTRERSAAIARMATDSFQQYRTPILIAGATLAALLVTRGVSRRRSRIL